MVAISLVTSGALMLTPGLVVGNVITNGLVKNREESTKRVVDAGTNYASQQLNSQILNAQDSLRRQHHPGRHRHSRRARRVPRSRSCPGSAPTPRRPGCAARGAPTLPPELTQAVQEAGYANARRELDLGAGEGKKLYLVFGQVLDLNWGQVQMYYLYPVDEVLAQANLVSNTILGTSVALVIMLSLVVYMVTRMVVRPVRVAARTAQRLSNGLLDQRMEVGGEDDLAAL